MGYNEIFPDYSTKFHNGYAILNGVQFDRCGQYDTLNAGLVVNKVGSSSANPVVNPISMKNSVMHHCEGICLYIDDSSHMTFDNNMFFRAKKFIVYVENVISDYHFTNNVLIGALKR